MDSKQYFFCKLSHKEKSQIIKKKEWKKKVGQHQN